MNPLLCALEVCSLFPYTPSANQRYLHAVNEIKNIYFWCFCMLTDTQVGFDKCKKKQAHVFIVHTRDVAMIFFRSQLLMGGRHGKTSKVGEEVEEVPAKLNISVCSNPRLCVSFTVIMLLGFS